MIAIAAPIGGGKSSLVDALATALGTSQVLRFDDHETATRQSVAQLSQWLGQGADFDALEAPGLCEALSSMRGDAPVIFEMPLGRAWSATAALIDVMVWVDVPLDIALARRLRDITSNLVKQSPDEMKRGLAWLNDYLAHYAGTLHAVLEAQRRVVRPQADLVVDGLRDVATLAVDVLQFVKAHHV